MKKEEIVKGGNSNFSNKVLPVSNTSIQSSAEKKDDKLATNKSKALPGLKELLRRAAAAAKFERGGKFIGRKIRNPTITALNNDDELSITNESPKTSFRWEAKSLSAMASSPRNVDFVSSTLSKNSTMASYYRKGNWITTDKEFCGA